MYSCIGLSWLEVGLFLSSWIIKKSKFLNFDFISFATFFFGTNQTISEKEVLWKFLRFHLFCNMYPRKWVSVLGKKVAVFHFYSCVALQIKSIDWKKLILIIPIDGNYCLFWVCGYDHFRRHNLETLLMMLVLCPQLKISHGPVW